MKKKRKKYECKTEKFRHEYVVKKREEFLHPYTREQLEHLLPSVGDSLKKTPVALASDLLTSRKANTRDCVVVEVNSFALWYRVRFKAGYCECFKIPEF